MGFVYGTGMMREKSKSKSSLHHNFAAEGGNMQSKMTLAFTYLRQDMHDKAVKLYAELAETAVNSFLISKDSPVVEPTRIHSGTEENKGALRKSRGEEDEDFQILEYQAQKGNAAAMYKIGLFYYFGLRGLRHDHTKALHWFSKAVEKGEPRSMELILFPHLVLCGAAAEVFPELIPWKEEKKEFVSIGELHTFIANSSEQTEEADFLCKDQIVGVVQENGLSFVSCTGCNRKLAKSLWCNRCVSPNAPGSSAFTRVPSSSSSPTTTSTAAATIPESETPLTSMNSANPKRSSIPARGDGTFDRLTEEAVEEIEAASSSGDPHSQSLMGFVYGTGMMREKRKSKSFLHHNFAAEGGNMQSKMTFAFTYLRQDMHDKAVKLYAELAETAVNSFLISKDSPVVEPTRIHSGAEENKGALRKSRGEEDEDFSDIGVSSAERQCCGYVQDCTVGRLLCLWDSHNIKKIDEFMGISLLLLDEQTEEADFLCKAQIVGVVQQNGLSFVSCTGCNRKLAKSLWCNRCVSPNAPGSSAVDDGKESATFVVFDWEMIKLIKKEAKSGSCVDTLVAVGGMELPKCLEELAGNGYLSSYSGNSNKAPVMDLKSGQPTAFASSAGDAAKIALGNDGANQPGSAYCSQRQNPQTPT
ncbi:hypothetical protein F2Q69_00024923 [Brassica cretica]|uniref:Uncharacterized protein n=1 Tax=Brassica cretica TaxID=69181 RepID=A0A8S9PXS6_BRACR|nr:hypothetical protein F2Q69_00024923 [Brassica cretica]